MGKKDYEMWPDQMLDAQIQGTIRKLEDEKNVDFKIGLREYLNRLLTEREKRETKRGNHGQET